MKEAATAIAALLLASSATTIDSFSRSPNTAARRRTSRTPGFGVCTPDNNNLLPQIIPQPADAAAAAAASVGLRSVALQATARKAAGVSTSTSSSYARASELLDLLLADDGVATRDRGRIESLVDDLTKVPRGTNTYDPNESLYGDLYCTIYAYTPNDPGAPEPLWERISLRKDNVKGQQYFATDGDEVGCGSVINYSEIWGPDVHLRAYGTFAPRRKEQDPKQQENKRQQKGDFLSSLLGGFSMSRNSARAGTARSATVRACPDDYAVAVSKASISVLGQSIDVPIRGSSCLRVLYADPRLRIFLSPESSDSIAGEWESSGLVVVQVRSDVATSSLGGEVGRAIDLRS